MKSKREQAIALKIFMTPSQLKRLDDVIISPGNIGRDRNIVQQTIGKILFAAMCANSPGALNSQPSTSNRK